MRTNNLKRVFAILLTVLLVITFLVSCKNTSADCEGKYTKDDFYISLNKDGSFIAENYIKLEGTYSVDATDVVFNVTKMNGEEYKSIVAGKLEADTLTGPDSLEYKKTN